MPGGHGLLGRIAELFEEMLRTIYHTQDVKEGLLYNIHYQMNPEHVMKTGHDYAAVLQKKIDVMEY